jgi:hypothetical protein
LSVRLEFINGLQKLLLSIIRQVKGVSTERGTPAYELFKVIVVILDTIVAIVTIARLTVVALLTLESPPLPSAVDMFSKVKEMPFYLVCCCSSKNGWL